MTRNFVLLILALATPVAAQTASQDLALRDAVSRARFEPATRKGMPVAVNMVWLVAHTTVRGKHPPLRGLSKT